ncbi:MAG: DUF1289 domain-containing protein [Stappiaceae bacterium]
MPEIISPCVNICKIDRVTNTCIGCSRSLSEIADWQTMSDKRRAEIMARIGHRKRLHSQDT